MASALYKFVVGPSDTPDLRKHAGDLNDEAVEAAGLTGHGIYLRGSACYLYLEGDAPDPLAALREHGKTRSWLSRMANLSTFTPDAPGDFAYRRLMTAGDLPAEEARFFRLVCDPSDQDTVMDAFESLPPEEAMALGVKGLEAWWRAPELVLRAHVEGLDWLMEPVESLGRTTLMEFLHRHTDLNTRAPERFALKEIHHVLDDRHAVGVSRSPA